MRFHKVIQKLAIHKSKRHVQLPIRIKEIRFTAYEGSGFKMTPNTLRAFSSEGLLLIGSMIGAI